MTAMITAPIKPKKMPSSTPRTVRPLFIPMTVDATMAMSHNPPTNMQKTLHLDLFMAQARNPAGQRRSVADPRSSKRVARRVEAMPGLADGAQPTLTAQEPISDELVFFDVKSLGGQHEETGADSDD